MRKYQAFTLIELMVVIAIIAITTTIASGIYKNYIVKSRVSQALAAVNDYIDQAVALRMQNGAFPTTPDLGLPEDATHSGDATYADPTSVNQYISSISMLDSAYGGACGSCCAGGEYVVTLTLNGDAIGMSEIGTGGGCAGFGIQIITTITTDGNVKKLCLTDYSNIVPDSCYYTCSSSSSGWPGAAQDQLTYMTANQECGRAAY